MTRIAQKKILAIGITVAILVASAAINTFAFQEEKISPLSDYQYNKKDFPRYEEIKKEADVQKRAGLLLEFVKERPISRILIFATTDYLAAVKPHIDAKDWAKALSMMETWWAALPTEESVKAEQIPVGTEEFLKDHLQASQKLLLSSMLQVHMQSNNLPKAAETVEKLYAMTPDDALLPVMANIYLGMKNEDKYLEIAQKMLEKTPIDQGGYAIALQMAQVYIGKQDVATATGLLTKIMDVYGEKVPDNVPEEQWNATRAFAYGLMASSAYAAKDYAKTQELYEKVVKYDPKNDVAYYYIGMCKWQNKDQEGAIDSFAKTVVLNKTMAAKAKQYMEDLYKAQHSGAADPLAGLDEVLAKARTELGVS